MKANRTTAAQTYHEIRADDAYCIARWVALNVIDKIIHCLVAQSYELQNMQTDDLEIDSGQILTKLLIVFPSANSSCICSMSSTNSLGRCRPPETVDVALSAP